MGPHLHFWLNLALAGALLLLPARASSGPQQVSGTAADIGWVVETIDSANDVGRYNSLALESSNDFPRISYYDATAGDLKYAAWNGAAWQIVTVDSADDVGQYSSLALDPVTGAPRIAYHDETHGDLKYAAWNGTAWQIEVVDSIDASGRFASLALDPVNSQPRISYQRCGTGYCDLRYATWNGTAWQISRVDWTWGYTGYFSSLALDLSNSAPRIAYQRWETDGDLMVATWDDQAQTWQISTPALTDSAGHFSDLALDADSGNPTIVHYFSNLYVASLVSWNGTSWSNIGGGQSGGHTSLALDPTNGPKRGYPRYADRAPSWDHYHLRYHAWDGSLWQSQTVYDQAPIAYASLQLDRVMGEPHIAFYDEATGDLKLATRRVPPPPLCRPGYIEAWSFGPGDLYPPSDPAISFNFNLTTGQGPAGELRVWQGEGHFWDANCNAGPHNDNGRNSCDQGQTGEIIAFYVNNYHDDDWVFSDHSPDDDRNFYYEWPLSNLQAGLNTLYLNDVPEDNSVFYRGTVCAQMPALAISLASFKAVAQASDILLRWETTSEVNNTGFNIYRSTATGSERVLLAFVPSQAPSTSQGFAYEWLDSDITAGETFTYWLEAVDINGATTLHGPVSATFQAPTAVTVAGMQAAALSRAALGWWMFAGGLVLLAGIGLLVRRR